MPAPPEQPEGRDPVRLRLAHGPLASPAQPEEAAALVAALEQFLRDTAAAPTTAPPERLWRRAALLEGVGQQARRDRWGDPQPWGRQA